MSFRQAAQFGMAGAWIVATGTGAGGQQSSAPPPSAASAPSATITVNAQLVNLPVIVRDKKGAIVQNLTKADFALSVDGHPQTIRYFDKDDDLPLTLGLLVDTSGSVRSALEDERRASEAFLDQMMTEPAAAASSCVPDKAFLIQFAHETDLLEDLTSSRPALRDALNRVGEESGDDGQNSQGNNGGRGGYGHHGGWHHAGGTTLYDAIYLASDNLMKKQQGRKAVVVLTDGEDRGSMETLASAIAAAQRAETVVYAIYFKGEQHGGGGHGGGWGGHGGYPGGGGGGRGGEKPVDGKKVLEQITGETGGRMFEVTEKQNFAAIYTQIAEELRSQYRLGYTPDAASSAAGFHRVDLTLTKDKKLFVQTRDGYYTGS
jgi:VWFA-related protein